MNKVQHDALVQLMGSGRMTERMQSALWDHFTTEGQTLKTVAARHGVSFNGLSKRLALARTTMEHAYALITGIAAPQEDDDDEAGGEAGHGN